MIFEESEQSVGGLRLRRYAWRPGHPPCGGVMMMHGLGDYLLRYEHVARFFVARGFACEGFDFPGHGKSSGQRGHIPRWDMLSQLLDAGFDRLRSAMEDGGGVAGVGLFAHSMGAYVGLDYLSRRPGRVRFAWLSSPLVRPTHGRPEWLLRLVGPVGRCLPWFPYDTGVRSSDCVAADAPGREQRACDPYLHHQTSFGFGRELIRREPAIWRGARSLGGDLDILVTHGTEDHVCPYGLSRELFEEIPLAKKRFVPVEGERHEPLTGGRQEPVFAAAAAWLEKVARPGEGSG